VICRNISTTSVQIVKKKLLAGKKYTAVSQRNCSFLGHTVYLVARKGADNMSIAESDLVVLRANEILPTRPNQLQIDSSSR